MIQKIEVAVITLLLQVEVEVSVQDSVPCPRATLANVVLMMSSTGQWMG